MVDMTSSVAATMLSLPVAPSVAPSRAPSRADQHAVSVLGEWGKWAVNLESCWIICASNEFQLETRRSNSVMCDVVRRCSGRYFQYADQVFVQEYVEAGRDQLVIWPAGAYGGFVISTAVGDFTTRIGSIDGSSETGPHGVVKLDGANIEVSAEQLACIPAIEFYEEALKMFMDKHHDAGEAVAIMDKQNDAGEAVAIVDSPQGHGDVEVEPKRGGWLERAASLVEAASADDCTTVEGLIEEWRWTPLIQKVLRKRKHASARPIGGSTDRPRKYRRW